MILGERIIGGSFDFIDILLCGVRFSILVFLEIQYSRVAKRFNIAFDMHIVYGDLYSLYFP